MSTIWLYILILLGSAGVMEGASPTVDTDSIVHAFDGGNGHPPPRP